MSIQIIARVLPKRWGSPSRKIVAIKLADVAREDGSKIYPSIATVASEAELSERQVQRVLEEFRKEGLLVVVTKGGGRNRTTEYRFDLAAVDALPDAKPLSDFAVINGDNVTPFKPERVTLTTLKGDTMSPNPSLPVRIPSTKEDSASREACAEAPSATAKIWKEGRDLLNASSSKPSPSIIGKWLKRTITPEAKEKLLAMISAARNAGTDDPVGYVTAALNRECPAPADPKSLDLITWQRNAQAALKTKAWSSAWGPAPGLKGCLMPSNLITPELIRALSERRIAA
jgi:hypothetical protein